METACPHEEQKRTFSEDTAPQPEQVTVRTDCTAPQGEAVKASDSCKWTLSNSEVLMDRRVTWRVVGNPSSTAPPDQGPGSIPIRSFAA
jgi:hypothetical protein